MQKRINLVEISQDRMELILKKTKILESLYNYDKELLGSEYIYNVKVYLFNNFKYLNRFLEMYFDLVNENNIQDNKIIDIYKNHSIFKKNIRDEDIKILEILSGIIKYSDSEISEEDLNLIDNILYLLFENKYEIMEMLIMIKNIFVSNNYEKYIDVFSEYIAIILKNSEVHTYPLGCGKDFSSLQSCYIKTLDLLNDILELPFITTNEYFINNSEKMIFIEYFGIDIVHDQILDIAEDIDVYDYFYDTYMIERVQRISFSDTEQKRTKSLSIEEVGVDTDLIEKINYLTPSIQEYGVTYFHSKQLDLFIESEMNKNNECNKLDELIKLFNQLTYLLGRDTLTQSTVKIIDSSSKIFSKDIKEKYAIICGYTSPGEMTTSRNINILESECLLNEGTFINNNVHYIKKIKEIIDI